MSKSLNRCMLAVVCIALVCALGLSLLFIGGETTVVAPQEGQAASTAKNTATYTHGSNIGRSVPSGTRQVNKGADFVDAVSNNQNISITGDFDLTSSQSFLKKDNSGKISADPATSGTALVYSGTIYGNGYNITITGSQAISNNSAVWDCGPSGYGDAANIYGGLVGKLTGQIYDLNVTMKSGTMEKIKGNDGGDRWLDVGVIAGILDDANARIENCSVTIPANTQITALKSPISDPGLLGSSAGTQYVRAAGIAAELNNGTIVNCTVTNNGCISAGLQNNKDDNSITNGYYGAVANAVAWVNNGTLNNIIVKGSGKLIGLKTAAISVVNNSNNSPTTNAYNGYTGTYEFRHGDDGGNWSTASMYVSGARQAIANFYQASNATTRGGANKDQKSHELANSGTTLTVNPSTYTIYFDPKKSSDDTRLAVLFNNENYSAGAEYELYGARGQISNAQISGANGKVLARNLTASPDPWNSGNNFTASVQIAFDPTSYAKLTKYDHGYVDPDNRTTNGTAIGTGEAFEAVFSPSGTISGTDYYLTNDIVITGFTGKEFSGTLDGNGHTIFITGANTCAAQHIGGIVGTLTGTIKNVRVVLVNSVTANTSVSNANVGLVAGHINGGSLINVSVDIPADVTLKHTDSGNDSSLGGIAGSAVSGATFTNVTMNFNGTLSNIKTSSASGGYWPFTSAFVGKPYFKDSANSSANCATFNNIIIRGNGTFASQSSADDEPPYYAAIGIIQHKGVTNSTAAVYNVNGLIYDFNPQFADNQGATSGNHGACYGLFVNNNNGGGAQVQYYGRLVNYGSGGVYNASGEPIEAHAFNGNGNAPVPNPANIKNISANVTGVAGSTVKAYFMPGDSASEKLTLVASASNWNGVTQLQLDGAAPAVTSADDGSNKVVNVAKSTAVSISGENLTLSPYNPYTVITASLDNPSKGYDGNPFAAQVSFTDSTGAVTLTAGDDYNITYTDGGNTGETNANASGGTYSLTVTLKGTASDGTQYVFDAQGTKTKTFTYTITPLEVTGTWSVRGLEITYGDSDSTLDASHIVINLTDDSIPGGLTERYIVAKGFNSDYVQGTTQAGETVTISEVDFDITEDNGIIADNYTLNITAGENTVEVQKRKLSIALASEDLENDPYVPHVSATYGATGDKSAVQGLLTWDALSQYVSNNYNNEEVTFTIDKIYVAAYTDPDGLLTLDGATEVQDSELTALDSNTYLITVTAGDNYTVQEGQFIVYGVQQATLTVTGVTLEGFDGDYIYDGNAHNVLVTYSRLVGEDQAYDFGITIVGVDGTSVTNAGTYTVSVEANIDDTNYAIEYQNGSGKEMNNYEVTISPITLTPSPVKGTFTEYTSSNLPTGASFVTSGILESDSGVTVAVTWGSNAPADNLVGNGNYVAVNTYTANLAIQGDTNGNYALSADTATFTIKAYDLANATITVEASGLVYDGTEKTATVTVKAGEADITDLVTITGNKATNAGDDYQVTVTAKDGDGNTTGSQTAGTTWSIAKADYNMEGVTFENDSITYDGESHTLTISEDSLPTGEDGIKVTVTYSATSGDVNITNVGSVKITATFATKSGNYNTPAAKTATLTIAKADYNMEGVTFEDGSITYDGESHTLTISEDSLPTGADGIKVTVEYTAANGGEVNITNVGSVKITATFATTSTNYNTPAAKTATLTIEKKAVTVTWKIGDIIRGTDPDKVKDTAEVTNNGGILEGDEYTFTVTLPLKDGSGDYTTTTPEGTVISVTPSLKFTDSTDEGNYDITYSPATLEWKVQQPEVKISLTAPTVEKTYAAGFVTEADFLSNFTGTFTTTDTKADLTSANFDITITKQGADGTTVGVGRLDVGTYTVAISLAAGSQYTIADGSTLTYTYTVTAEQWTATVVAPDGGLTYNGADQFSSLVITPGEANNTCDGAPTIAAVVTGGEMKNAGTYTVTLELQTADGEAYTGGNFVLTADSAKIEIAKLKVEIEWEANGDLVYNGQAHTLTATITNKVETDNVTAIVEKHSGDNINVADGGFSYTITGLKNNELGNYTLKGVSNITSQAFNITPATLTVADSITKTFGDIKEGELFAAIGSEAVTGMVNDEDLSGIVEMTTTLGSVEWKGESYYVAAASGATVTVTIIDSNYTFAGSAKEAGVTLSIVKLDDTITISETKTAYYYDVYKRDEATGSDNFFTVSTVSGLPVQITYYNGGDGSSPYDSLNSGDYISFDVTSTNIAVINITPTEDELSVNFNITPQRVTYTVAARHVNVAIDLTDVNPTYTGTAFSIPNEAVTVTDSDGTPSHADVSGQILVLMQGASDAEGANAVVNAGAYTVSAKSESSNVVINDTTFEGDVNTVTIAPAAIDVTLAQTEFTYGDTIDLGATVTAIEGTDDVIGVQIKNIVMDGAEDTGATVTNFLNAGAGTYFVTFELTGDDAANYELSATSNPATVTINRKQVTITWTDGGEGNFVYTYDGTAKVPTASVTEGAVDPDTFADVNKLATIGGALTDEKAINAGSYTATITKEAFEAQYDNYTIAEDSEREFVINPQPVTVTMTMKDSESTDVTSPLTWNVSSAIVVERAENVWTLTSGDVSYTVTVTGFESVVGFNSSKLELHLDNEEYTGTPYGTPVTDGVLGIVSADPNYEISMSNDAIILNVVPSLAIELAEGAEISVVYGFNKSYNAAADTNNAFAQYFTVQTSDGSVAPAGTWSYTVVGENQAQTIQDVGTYTIEATYIVTDGGATLKNSIKFSITAAQVSEVTLGTITYGDLSATGKITATITYADGTSERAELSYTADDITAGPNKTITLVDYENVNTNYAGFDSRAVTVTIAPATVTVEVKPEYTSYRGVEIDLFGTITGGVFGTDEVSVGVITTNNPVCDADTYTITGITLTGAAASNYTVGSFTESITIEKHEVTITVTPNVTTTTPTYTGSKIGLAISVSKWMGVPNNVYVTVNGENAQVADFGVVNAGTYTVGIGGSDANNYMMSAASTSSFTIAKAEATLSIANYATINGQEYNGQPVTITPEMTVGGVSLPTDGIVEVSINDTTDYPGTATDQILYAGSYTVTLSVSGDNNIEDTSEYFTVTIDKKAVRVITADTSEYSYDGTAKDLDERVTEAGPIGDDEVTAMVASIVDESGTTVTELKNAGTYTVTFGLSGDDARNYVIAEKDSSMTVTINPAPVTVEVKPEYTSYRGVEIALSGTITDGVFGTDAVSVGVITTNNTVRNAGDYTITAEDIALTGAAAANYTVGSVTGGSFTIAPATVTVTVTAASTTYTGEDIILTGSAAALGEDVLGVTVTPSTVRNAGTYTITAEDIALTGAAAANYTVGSFTESITIAPATATLNKELLEGLVATYGDIIASDGVLTGGFSETVFVTAGDTELEVTITITPVTREPLAQGAIYVGAGSYILTVEIEDTNYAFEEGVVNTVALTVQAKPLDLSVTIPDTTYSSTGVAVNLNDFAEQIVGDDSVDVTIYVTDASGKQIEYTNNTVLNAGTYTVSYEVDSANYAVSVPEEPVTITIAPQAVQAPDRVIVGGSTTVEKNEETGQLELDIAAGEAVNLEQTINNVLSSNHGTTNNDYTITVTDKDGNAVEGADISNLGTLTEGEYTVSVEMSNSNYSGGMTFVVTVSSGSILTPENPPAGLPETPLGGVAEADGNDWLFPVLVAVVALIDICLLAAICIVAKIKRDRNKA